MSTSNDQADQGWKRTTEPLSGSQGVTGRALTPPKGYEIVGEIARGGMGVVYKARQKMPSRMVALKVMLQGALASEEEKKRFLLEANAAAALKHPGIVPVYEVGEHEGKYFFSMEYIEGLPLNKYLDQTEFTLKEKLHLFLKICDAVTHAHIRGVIHRDLKPSNIMIDKEGNPRLLDFGLAKLAEMGTGERRSFVTMSGVLMGTPAYMSPEQTLGKQELVDTRSDVYSLGVILYEMLTGAMCYPVDSQDLFEVIHSIREREPQRPSTLARALRGDLETILLKAIAKEKERRYQSAADLARDLRHFLANEPIEARPSSVGYRLTKTVQRHKVGAATIGLAVIFFLVAFVWINYLRIKAEVAEHRALISAEQEAKERKRAEDERYRADNAAKAETQQRKAAQEAKKQAEQDRDRALRESYFSNIHLAASKVQSSDLQEAEQALDSCPPQFRNWEWGRLMFLANPVIMTLKGHSLPVLVGLAFSPDGTRIASGSFDNTIKIWDAKTGRGILTLNGHSGGVMSVAFSPDGMRIASSGCWGKKGEEAKTPLAELKIWDAGTGRQLMALKGHDRPVLSVAFSPDGKCIASGGVDGTTRIWDAQSGRQLTCLKTDLDLWVFSVAFSPDGKRIASGCAFDKPTKEPNIFIWDGETGKTLATLKTLADSVYSVAFSPRGTRLASCGAGQTINVWDTGRGQELLALKSGGLHVRCLAFSPDGQRIASIGPLGPGGKLLPGGYLPNQLIIWDANTGRKLRTTLTGSRHLAGLAFSPDGARLAVSGFSDNTVKILDAQAGCEAPVYHSEARGPVAFTQDGNLLVSTPKQSQCEVLDIETGRELIRRGLGGQLEGLAVSLDGKRFACVVYFHPSSRPGYRDMQVWDIETGRRLTTLSKPDVRQLATPRSWVGVSLWCGSLFPGSVKLVSKGSPADMAGLKGGDRIISINDQQVSSSHELQRLMASQGVGSTIRLAVERDKSRVQLNVIPAEFPKDKDHLYYRPCLSFTRDGKQIVSGIGVSEDEAEAVVAQIWDAETGHPVRTLKPNPATSECIPFDFRANGGRFAFRTVGERTLNVVDAQTWRQLLAIATDPDSRFELSQDGKYIAFWQAGNAITLLDIETGREGVSLNGHTDQVTFIAFSRDGKRIFTTERGSILRVWDAQSGRELITEELHMEELDSAALSPDGRFLAVTGGNDGVVILKAADWRTPERQ